MNKPQAKRLLYEVQNISKEYDAPGGSLPILKSVNLEVYAGDLIFIIGRSGCGKSTLLHLMGGLDEPTSGRLFFDEDDFLRLSERRRTKIRNQKIGFVFQAYHLLPELTVLENVMLPALISGKKDQSWVMQVLKKVELSSRRFHFPAELSGGEQQRVALARALVNRPELVLCDEPTGNLDTQTAEKMFQLILDLNEKEGQAFVIVTHDERLAMKHKKVYRLDAGVLTPAH
ncbi:MAG TPA: lipoprotein-releasing system ATP-binding protein LolD [Candidatus Omnitrophica bacterium]|nr:lipoprotein-releasing system ATP-binding protein LolD [Candidatus Omnitrophota bacterium]